MSVCCAALRNTQVQPELIKAAEVAIDEVIGQLPKDLVAQAQQLRAQRVAATE
jgi:hypothetical protein